MLGYIVVIFVIIPNLVFCQLRRNVSEDVIFQFYTTSNTSYVPINITDPGKLLTSDGYDNSRNTVFYSCGFEELMNWESIQTILSAYIFRNDHNIVIVDWTNLNQGNYMIDAYPNTFKLAVTFAKSIATLVDKGMSPDRIHLVGHSLGAQLSGITGQNLLTTYNILIGRMTYLDAAGPLFGPPFGFTILKHADETGAKFVDSIHTDTGFMGYLGKNGKVSFYPNRGVRHQPGCQFTIPWIYPYYLSAEALCSHWNSWRFWAESLRNPNAFPATPCGLFNQVLRNVTPINFMGYAADPSMEGDFCLKTGRSSPYGLGEKGIK